MVPGTCLTTWKIKPHPLGQTIFPIIINIHIFTLLANININTDVNVDIDINS